jgi:DNA-binding CsgD family transcriptional regulator
MAFDRRPGKGASAVRLSERELDVVRLVVDGHSNDEIGARLGIGPKTVESHLRRLFERFDLASRTELATRALREGWLEVPPGA